MIVLVNGAWHGAWCWTLLQHELWARGVPSAAVEVPGFGGLSGGSPTSRDVRLFSAQAFATEVSPVAGLTLADVLERFVADIRKISNGPVAVVAHSISGFIVSAAAEAWPNLFSSVTYLAAITPLADLTAAEYNVEPEMAQSLLIDGLVGDPQVIGAARCDFRGDYERTIATFYHDVAPDLARRATALLASDVPFGINGLVVATDTGLRSVRQNYVFTEDDRAIPLAMQQRIVAEIENSCGPIETRSLAASHSPFLSQPGHLADVLDELCLPS